MQITYLNVKAGNVNFTATHKGILEDFLYAVDEQIKHPEKKIIVSHLDENSIKELVRTLPKVGFVDPQKLLNEWTRSANIKISCGIQHNDEVKDVVTGEISVYDSLELHFANTGIINDYEDLDLYVEFTRINNGEQWFIQGVNSWYGEEYPIDNLELHYYPVESENSVNNNVVIHMTSPMDTAYQESLFELETEISCDGVNAEPWVIEAATCQLEKYLKRKIELDTKE